MTVFEIILVALTTLLVIMALMKGFLKMLAFIVEFGIYVAAILFGVGPISKLLGGALASTGMNQTVLSIVSLAGAILLIIILVMLVVHIPKYWLGKWFRKGKAIHPFDRAAGVVVVALIMFALTSVLTAFFNDGQVFINLFGNAPIIDTVFGLLGFGKVEGATGGLTGFVIELQTQVREGAFLKYLVEAGNPLGEMVLGMFA